jgi:hypothetical protein
VKHAGPNFGRLLSPRQYSRIVDTAAAGIPWAADNDCFQGLDWKAYPRMLEAIRGVPGCLFVTAPDVVANWEQTRHRFDSWWTILRDLDQPVAYVLQDGQPLDAVPWEQINAVFIGGSTEYKLSAAAERLAREAKSRGLWLHMGRVNSRKRMHYARAIGCDSVDGTKYSRFRDRWLPEGLEQARDHLQERIPA